MSDVDLIALGQALDTSWGRSSTPQTASFSVKFTVLGPDRVMAAYGAIVNFGTERAMIEMKRAQADESQSVLSEVLKHVKASYKDLCGKTLKTKELSSSDSLEVLTMSPYNAKRTCCFRRKVVYEVG